MPSCSSVAVGGELADDLPFVDDEDPVREREDLLELERDQQDAAALVALLDEAPVHELDRPDVEAARRLRGDQHARVAVDLAGEDDLLLVATRERAGARLRAAAAHVELLDEPRRPLDEPPREEPAESRVRRAAVVVQRDVLGDRELQHEPAPLAILRNVTETRVVVGEGGEIGEVGSPRGGRCLPATGSSPLSASISSVWPLPSMPAMPDDLAGPHLERDVAHLLDAAVVERAQALDLQQRLAGLPRACFSTRSRTSRPTISRASPSSVAPFGVERLDLLARAAGR